MGDYVESFVVIPFTRIFRQQLTPEESQLVARGIYEKDFYEDMEKFKK